MCFAECFAEGGAHWGAPLGFGNSGILEFGKSGNRGASWGTPLGSGEAPGMG